MARTTNIELDFRRIQVDYNIKPEQMNETFLREWLDGDTLGTQIFASELEGRAVKQIRSEVDIESIQSYGEIKELEKQITIPQIKDDLTEQREVILERTKQVQFFGSDLRARAREAETLGELDLIGDEAEDVAEELGVTNFRKFFGKSFEQSSQKFL